MCSATTTLSSDVCMHSTANATAVEKKEVQLLEQRVSGEMAASIILINCVLIVCVQTAWIELQTYLLFCI